MTCDDIAVVDAHGLEFSKVDLEMLLKKQEIPYYVEQDGVFYFKTKYARDMAKILYLKAHIDEITEVLPEGYFKGE